MDRKPVYFDELSNYNDSNSCVMVALLVKNESEIEQINDFLANELGFSKGKKIIGYHHIEGNIKGQDGRSDYLFEFDHPEKGFNPLARIRCPFVKWTSDFMDNFQHDYIK